MQQKETGRQFLKGRCYVRHRAVPFTITFSLLSSFKTVDRIPNWSDVDRQAIIVLKSSLPSAGVWLMV
jgi:hypothetical protein